jgi:hypothetical protein
LNSINFNNKEANKKDKAINPIKCVEYISSISPRKKAETNPNLPCGSSKTLISKTNKTRKLKKVKNDK